MPYISGTGNNNLQFQDVDILAATLTSGTLALNPIGTGSTSNLVYVFPTGFTVGSGATLSFGTGINVILSADQTITDYGSVIFAGNNTLTFTFAAFNTTELIVENGASLSVNTTQFTQSVSGNDTSELEVDTGGQIQVSNSSFSLTEVALNNSLTTGNLTNNSFNCPLYVPYTDLPYLSGTGNNNYQFQDINILPGTLSSGTLSLNAIGTGSTANLLYIFATSFTIDVGTTLSVGSGVGVSLTGGTTINDYGSLTFVGNDTVTFASAFDVTTEILVAGGASLNVTSTLFTVPNTFALTSEIVINNGGQFVSTESTYTSLTQITLNNSLGSGNLSGNSFNSPLNLPASDIPYLSGGSNDNVQFQDIDIQAATISGGTLALNSIGTGSTANLAYFLTGNLTINSGATVAVGAGVPVTIDSGEAVLDYGNLTFGTDDTITFANTSTTQIAVENGGVLSTSYDQFTAASTSNITEITVGTSGQFLASNDTFTLTEITLNNSLSSGSIVGNSFNCTLYLLATDIQYLSGSNNNNAQFQQIVISSASFSGGTLALNAIGTVSNANLVYVFNGNFTLASGSTISVGQDVNVLLDAGVTLIDNGTVNFNSADTMTLAYVSGDTTQIQVGSGGSLNAADTIFTNTTPNKDTAEINVIAGGQFTASNDTFNITSVSLGSGSNDILQFNSFSSQLMINSAAVIAIQDNDFANIPASPVNDGIIASGVSTTTINLSNNYWGTTNTTQISALIDDHHISSALPTVNYSPLLSEPPTQTLASPVNAAYDSSSQNVTLTAAITSPEGVVNAGTETFTILSGLTVIGSPVTVSVSNGIATTPYSLPAGTAVGTYTIQDVYNGTSNFNGSSDSTQLLIIGKAATNTTATNESVTYSLEGQTANLSASIVSSGGTINAGTVTFTVLSGSTVIGSPVQVNVVSGNASASYTLPAATSAGTYTIEAVYSGTGNFLTSSDTSHTLTINGQTTTTATSSQSTNYTTASQSLYLGATVTGATDTVNVGTVTFTILSGSTVIGSPVAVGVFSDVASTLYTLPAATSVGTYTIEAVYGGTGNFLASSDTSQTLTINEEATTTAANFQSTSYAVASQSVNLSASVTGTTDTVNVGTVTFTIMNGSTVIGSPTTAGVSNGSASTSYIIPPATPGGAYTIEAAYNGTGNFVASSDTSRTLTIDAASTATAAQSSATDFSSSPQTIPLVAKVTSSAGTVNGGTETFTVLNGSTVIGTPLTVNVSSGNAIANYTLPGGTVGAAYTIQAVYNGTVNFVGSNDASHSLAVDSAPIISNQPTNQTMDAGNGTTFTAYASGYPTPTVQWQVSTNGGISFTSLSNGGVYSGANTNSLLITNAAASMNGYEYQAVFSNTLSGEGSPSTATSTAATLTVDSAPTVATSPGSKAINAGGNAGFTASATGNPAPAVQWQVSTDNGNTFSVVNNGGIYSGATTGTLNVSGATSAMNGYLYQAIFSNTLSGAGSPSTATSAPATLTVDYAPTVTGNPSNSTINSGGNASFTVAAAGNPSPTVQWQVSTNGGTSFNNVSNGGVYSGAATDTLEISGAGASMNGYLYQAIFSNMLLGAGSPSTATTPAAALTVDYAPTVTTNPTSATTNAGSNASFTATASANPTPTVQWQVSTDGGNTFNNVINGGVYSGATSGTLHIASTTTTMNGYLYQAVFSNTLNGAGSPSTATSAAATLTVDYAPTVAGHPISSTINSGGNASFTVAAAGNPSPTVQWQVSTNGGTSFNNVSDGVVYSGTATDTLEISGADASMNGYLYQAVFSNTLFGNSSASTATTTAATLTVDYAPTVTTNPTSATTNAGSNTSFTAAASGNPTPTVQWQVSTDGGNSYNNVIDGGLYSGASTTTLKITGAKPSMDGYEYQAVFSNTLLSAGSPSTETTTSATLTVDSSPNVTNDPTGQTVNTGGNTTFTVAATGNPSPTVQWQLSTDGGNTFANVSNGGNYAGANSTALLISNATASMNGYLYQAIFSNSLFGAGSPSTATTTAAILTVDSAPSIIANPISTVDNAGNNTSFTAAATGNPTPTVQWQVSTDGGTTFTNVSNGDNYSGANTDTLNIEGAALAMNGYEYQAVFSNTVFGATSPSTTTTSAALLTVSIPGAPTTSTVSLSSSTLQSSGTIKVTLQAKDLQGNDATSGGLVVVFGLGNPNSGGRGTFSQVTDNGDGTYSAFFTGTYAGSNTITATIGGVGITTPLPTITVIPGQIDPSQSQVSTLLPSVQLGGETTIVLQGEDDYGNKETSGGASNIAFELENSTGGQGTISSVTDNNNGTYTAAFIGTVDGSNTIEATIGSSQVTSAATIGVTGAAVNVADTIIAASPGSVQSGIGGIPVILQAEYGKGEKESSGGLNVAFGLASGSGGQGIFGPVSYMGNGEYTAIFTGTIAGSNTIVATIDGSKVTSKPAPINVTAGQLSYANSLVTVSSASVKAGTKVTVTFQPRDAAGNNLSNEKGLLVRFTLGGNSTAQGAFSNPIYNKNGTFTATFTGTIVGGSTIATTVNNEPITSTPPVITVTPGTASAAKSTLTVWGGNTEMVSGSNTTLTLQAMDSYGNLETTGGLAVAFKLASARGGQGAFSKVIDNKNGTYTVTFTGTIAGPNTIEATIAGAKVSSTAAITVTPGAYSLAKSVVTVPPPGSVAIGKTITVYLQTKDAAGNDLTTDLLTAAVTISLELGNVNAGGQGTFGSASYIGNGEYEATFTATSVGGNTVLAFIGNSNVTSKAEPIKVISAA